MVLFFPHQIKVEVVWNFIKQVDIPHSLYTYSSAFKIDHLLFTVTILLHLYQLGVFPDKDQITLQFKMSTAILTFAENEDVVVL